MSQPRPNGHSERLGVAGSGAVAWGSRRAPRCVAWPLKVWARSAGRPSVPSASSASEWARADGAVGGDRVEVVGELAELSALHGRRRGGARGRVLQAGGLRRAPAPWAPGPCWPRPPRRFSVEALAAACDPARFFGLHVFNPVTQDGAGGAVLPDEARGTRARRTRSARRSEDRRRGARRAGLRREPAPVPLPVRRGAAARADGLDPTGGRVHEARRGVPDGTAGAARLRRHRRRRRDRRGDPRRHRTRRTARPAGSSSWSARAAWAASRAAASTSTTRGHGSGRRAAAALAALALGLASGWPYRGAAFSSLRRRGPRPRRPR